MKMRPQVSDHAMLRYIERVNGIDLSFIRREIERTTAPAVAVGARSVSKDGFTYMIGVNGVVVTIIDDQQGCAGRRRRTPRDFRECAE